MRSRLCPHRGQDKLCAGLLSRDLSGRFALLYLCFCLSPLLKSSPAGICNRFQADLVRTNENERRDKAGRDELATKPPRSTRTSPSRIHEAHGEANRTNARTVNKQKPDRPTANAYTPAAVRAEHPPRPSRSRKYAENSSGTQLMEQAGCCCVCWSTMVSGALAERRELRGRAKVPRVAVGRFLSLASVRSAPLAASPQGSSTS